jgi:hypothetical protein
MKHQYFGDIGDYKKFSILKSLGSIGELQTTVCWMLTPNDNRTDGSFIQYLSQAREWRMFDIEVFDLLRKSIHVNSDRNLKIIEDAQIIRGTTFFSKILGDDIVSRKTYFDSLFEESKKSDVIFFDPDNGIEVPSVQPGKRNSSKYIFRSEIQQAFEKGFSLLLYQHFVRENRIEFMKRIASSLQADFAGCHLSMLKTKNAFFIFLPQERHLENISKTAEQIISVWNPHIQLFQYKENQLKEISKSGNLRLFNE